MRQLKYAFGVLLIAALVTANANGQVAPTQSGQSSSGPEGAGPQTPSTPSGSPPPSAPSTGSAKPMPSIEGITVKLGDHRDSVAKAYPTATDIGKGNLALPSDGVKFFFNPDVLYEIMLEDPYKGTIEGIKLGATGDQVVAGRGKPDTSTSVFGGTGYMYYYEGGSFLRYDVDEKTNKVTDIVQMLPASAPGKRKK
jgi:hypothetical protein